MEFFFKAVLLWNTINHTCISLGVQNHPEDQGDFGQGLTIDISECTCNNQLELSTCVCNMCCCYMVLTNPHYKTLNSIHHYEDIYENSANLSKVSPVYGS